MSSWNPKNEANLVLTSVNDVKGFQIIYYYNCILLGGIGQFKVPDTMYYFGTLQIFSSRDVGLEHFSIEDGGKVVLPPTVLAEISDYASDSPMMFSLTHPITEVVTHCGVIEFSAEEGSIIAPSWILDQIGVLPGDNVYIESVYLPVGSYSRFKPMSTDFLDITDQKAVLENRLRSFSCLTTGDLIPISYNNKTYTLKVAETRPGDAICIVNCDLEVEFEEPVGYVAPSEREERSEKLSEPVFFSGRRPSVLASFGGPGYRLDGKDADPHLPPTTSERLRGVPDYDWKFGTITFFRDVPMAKSHDLPAEFSPFSGSGRSLK